MGLALLATPALADEAVHQPFEIGLFGGAHIFAADNTLGRSASDSHDLSPETMVAFGLRLGWTPIPRLGFELEGVAIPTKTRSGASANLFVLGYRGHVMLYIIDSGPFRPFILAGWGGITSWSSNESVVMGDTDDPIHVGVGAKIALSEHWGLRIDGRALIPLADFDCCRIGNETASAGVDFEAFLGVSFAFGGHAPAPLPLPSPPPPPPPPPPPADRDGDGIPDAQDACPDVAGVANQDPQKNGCPADRDGDGIPDGQDACPDVPGVADPDPKKNGCPADRDGDGIPDAQDACPEQPGPANPDPKKNGCPAVRVEKGQILILEQVKFKTGSDLILPESDGILGKVAQTVQDHPEIARVEVQGHTDNVGGKALNQRLSNRRAGSVVRWLTRNGVAPNRLTATGFGMSVPIDTNETPEGRQNNRRVEFHIIAK